MQDPKRESATPSDPAAAPVSDRMQRVMAELRTLQEEFHGTLQASSSKEHLDRVVDDVLAFQLVADLKATLDSLRNLLWAYMELSARQPTDDADARRRVRATEMLELMRTRLADSSTGASAESFFNRVDAFVEGRLRAHQAGPSRREKH
jgi:hypothetical protein